MGGTHVQTDTSRYYCIREQETELNSSVETRGEQAGESLRCQLRSAPD